VVTISVTGENPNRMGEQLYTYRRTKLPDGRETYERVPFNPNDVTTENPVLMPRVSPAWKNGEFPGMGCLAVDRLLQKTADANTRRALQESAGAPTTVIGDKDVARAPLVDSKRYRRKLEP
jgi:hypothetical protein